MKTDKKKISGVLENTPVTKWIEEYWRTESVMLERLRGQEPLGTFASNIRAVKGLFVMARTNVTKEVKKASKKKKIIEKHHIECALMVNELTKDIKSLYKRRKELEEKKTGAGGDKEQLKIIESGMKDINGTIKRYENLVPRAERLVVDSDEVRDYYSERIDNYVKQGELIMPMVFVYLVTIWDAFVIDTARKILRVDPQAITSGDTKTGVSKAVIWSVGSVEDVQNLLIEEVVNEISHDQQKLMKYFVDYWGIDWRESGIEMDDVVEIRARRDIWVHNKGIVNKQYLDMVGKCTSLKEGEVAEIDGKYMTECMYKLSKLAMYVQGVAYEKHYVKADVG